MKGTSGSEKGGERIYLQHPGHFILLFIVVSRSINQVASAQVGLIIKEVEDCCDKMRSRGQQLLRRVILPHF